MQKLWIAFLFMTIISCSAPKRPEGVLSQPQLSALLVDIYIAEARVDQMPLTKDSSIRFYLPFEEKLLKKKGIKDSMLKETYTYYLAHPRELEQVYDAVIDTLVLREQRISKTSPQINPSQIKPPPNKKLAPKDRKLFPKAD